MNTTLKVYTVAKIENCCYGHGDYGNELKIVQQNAYMGTGKFPTLHTKREDAETLCKEMNKKYTGEFKVVVLEIVS